jgi:hypothetical protein
LCSFILLVNGVVPALRYFSWLVASGIVISAALVATFGPAENLMFNLVTLSSHRPTSGNATDIGLEVISEALPAAFTLLLFGFHWFFYERGPENGWRSVLLSNRWLVFPMIGIFLIPVCIKARFTYGGQMNHIGLFVYFLVLGATLGINQSMTDGNGKSFIAVASRIVALTLMFVSAPEFTLTAFRSGDLVDSRYSPTWEAYEYDLRHPGKAYFPLNPLAAVFAEQRYYHNESALQDRSVAGNGINQAQFASGIPDHISIVAIPLDLLSEIPPHPTLAEFAAGWQRIDDPELPGWFVYQRPGALPAPRQ